MLNSWASRTCEVKVTKVIRIYPLWTINVCAKFVIWSNVVDRSIPLTHISTLNTNFPQP